MEKRKTVVIGVASGIALTVAVVFAIAFAFQNFSETSAADRSICVPDQQLKSAVEFPIAKPAWVPAGYSLQCEKVSPYQVVMLYSAKPIASTEFSAAINNDGAIAVIVNDETLAGENTNLMTPQQRLNDTTRLLTPELKEKMQFRYITINGHPGWAREAGSYGTLTAQYSNGTIISTEQTQEPARVQFYLETTEYIITGFRPADELIKVAESIPLAK